MYIQRMKITILGANLQFFRLERMAKFLYFIFCLWDTKHQVLLICNENKEICVALKGKSGPNLQ